ncbi:unnamed protein product [Pleuronectes platessa]|uniref:Uncharacterized protein n=2 Tax=Pleuronectes platessa TaxID=8262 RepID=A0A9N7VSC9_PLEPL|nr:unnamed protein product [Pleuronectes platessa]
MDREKAEERKNEINNFTNSHWSLSGAGLFQKETLQEAADQRWSSRDPAESSVQLLSICGYVDIHRHKNPQEVDVSEVDYTRVKEVNGDNILLPHKDRVHGCVDVQTREENIPEDYSRVEEVVGDNQLLLQRQSASSDSWEKSDRYTVFTNKKPRYPHEPGAGVTKVGPELIVGEYVDTFPTPPLM